MYNNNLKKHGQITFESHEEYNWLKWDEDISIFNKRGKKSNDSYHISKLAIFDINNDETIIFTRFSLSSILRDDLSTYPLSISDKRKNLNWPELNRIRVAEIFGGAYKLKEFPPKKERDFHGTWKKYYIDIGHSMHIRPMKVGGTYYVT